MNISSGIRKKDARVLGLSRYSPLIDKIRHYTPRVIGVGITGLAIIGTSYFIGNMHGFSEGRYNQRDSIAQYLGNKAYYIRQKAKSSQSLLDKEAMEINANILEAAAEYIDSEGFERFLIEK